MEKLTFFALSAPEKLDRIAAYLSEQHQLLVESFLGTLRLLLENERQHLHLLATNAFVKFANIEEDTPSYHRSYDFFVSRFSEMCHTEHEDKDLQDKHLDSHSLWEGRSFAVRCFQIIMYSIQSQHSHLVIQQLLGHLDAHSRSPASVRAGIVEVLSEAAVIEATGSVGPTVLEVFNTLLRQLRQSVDYQLTGYLDPPGRQRTSSLEEKTLQDAVIKTIGSFANTLPVYQRSEVMLFIMGKIPVPGIYPALGSPNTGRMIQVMLLKSLLQVSSRYESTNLLTALPCSFLQPLLCFTLMEDPEIRLLVLCILTSLLDRHHNTERLRASVTMEVCVLELKEERCSRQDNLFIRKEESSGRSHYQALFTLLAVVSVELANEEVMLDLIRLTLALQELALSNQESLSVYNRCGVHALCAAFLHLLSHLGPPPPFTLLVSQVIEGRQSSAPHLLPEDVFSDSPSLPEGELQVDEASLFVQSKISEALTGSSYSAHSERLNTPKSLVDVASLQMDPPFCCEAPQTEQITFETLKNAIEALTKELTIEELTIEQLTKEQTIEELTIEELTLEELTIEELTIEGLTIEELTIEELTIEELTKELTIEGLTIEELTIEEEPRGAHHRGANHRGANQGANHRGANHRGANHRGANLRGAHHRGANHRGANHRGANHRGANHRGANHRGANLRGAHHRGANHRGANRGANHRGANHRGANLRGANH
ncbi:Protein EFR3 like B [Dissostichus eleginoides]|uniref:Protein EFR3 like B n=1 Tax=Dissostichus eleginoides TaxID=100907 RepID=A0AAD9B2L9_DISEL|nr:Protein EFR3 like B [Dissostichus eleginoides]